MKLRYGIPMITLMLCLAFAGIMLATNTWLLTMSVVFVICAFTVTLLVFATVFLLSGDEQPPEGERERRFDEWDQRS